MSDASRRSFWKFVLFSVLAAVLLFTLTILTVFLANRARWSETRRDLIARGEILSLKEFAPKPVPPEQNFFGAGIWTEVTDRTSSNAPRIPKGERQLDVLNEQITKAQNARFKELLPDTRPPTSENICYLRDQACTELLKSADGHKRRELADFILQTTRAQEAALAAVTRALDRPAAVSPFDYSKNLSAPIDYTMYFLALTRTWQDRAIAKLELGDPGAAAADVRDIFRLAHTIDGDPLLIPMLIRSAVLSSGDKVIRAGLRSGSWNESQLQGFESTLSRIDLISNLQRCLRGERGAFNDLIDALRAKRIDMDNLDVLWMAGIGGPSPGAATKVALQLYLLLSVDGDRATANRLTQSFVDALDRSKTEGIKSADYILAPQDPLDTLLRQELLTRMVFPTIDRVVSSAARMQCQLDMTRIACALARYRMSHSSLPDRMDALSPDFLPALPHDLITASDFQYEKLTDEKFRLWSIGWDRKDNGGTPPKSRLSTADGDWVWDKEPGK